MKKFFGSALLALSLVASGTVLADPRPSNPVVGTGYSDVRIECFANMCQIQTFYWQYVSINGVGMWQILFVDIKTVPRTAREF